MYFPPISVPMPVHVPNVHGSLEGETGVGFSSPKMKRSKIKMSGGI